MAEMFRRDCQTQLNNPHQRHVPSLPVQYQYVCVILYMILLPMGGLSIINVGGRGIQPAWALGSIIAGLYFLNLVVGKKRICKDYITICLIILCFSIFLSINLPLLSGDQSRVIDFCSTFFQFILVISIFFAFISYKFSVQDLEKIIRWYLVIGAFMALFGTVQTASAYFGHPWKLEFTNESWIRGGGQKFGYESILGNFRRAAGLLREPRQLGAYLLGPLSVCLYLILYPTMSFTRFQQVLIFSILILGILCTFSISAYLVGTFCLFIILVFPKKLFSNSKSTRNISLMLFLAFGIFYLIWMFTDLKDLPYWRRFNIPTIGYLWHVFIDLVDRKIAAGSYAKYVGNMSFALHICMANPVFGVGVNNLEYFSMQGYHGAHQPWALFGECGLFGAFSYVLFFLIFIIQIRRLKRQCRKLSLPHSAYLLLLEIAIIFVILAPIKGMASLFAYYGAFFWFDMTLAGIIYFNLKRIIREQLVNQGDTTAIAATK